MFPAWSRSGAVAPSSSCVPEELDMTPVVSMPSSPSESRFVVRAGRGGDILPHVDLRQAVTFGIHDLDGVKGVGCRRRQYDGADRRGIGFGDRLHQSGAN